MSGYQLPGHLAARSRLANLHRANPRATPEQLDSARAELAAANIAAAVQRNLATAPPLTAEQRAAIAALLAG